MSSGRQKLGKWGEDQGAGYLIADGFNILRRNYRCRLGEIDIIAQKGEHIVFIEVKTRRSTAYGCPAEAVNFRKQAKYISIAMYFLKEIGIYDASCRFDIIEVMVHPDNTCSINHIENAFQAGSGRYY